MGRRREFLHEVATAVEQAGVGSGLRLESACSPVVWNDDRGKAQPAAAN
jgi:hypothetical protein